MVVGLTVVVVAAVAAAAPAASPAAPVAAATESCHAIASTDAQVSSHKD
jgi:hypothetical protein